MVALERSSFAPERQEGEPSLKRSLTSSHQEVWVLREDTGKAAEQPTGRTAKHPDTHSGQHAATQPLIAALVLRLSPRSVRLYSLAVADAYRGQGLGLTLLEHALHRARELGKERVSLEADAANTRLVDWYLAAGFSVTQRLPGYYGTRQHGVRMHMKLRGTPAQAPAASAC